MNRSVTRAALAAGVLFSACRGPETSSSPPTAPPALRVRLHRRLAAGWRQPSTGAL